MRNPHNDPLGSGRSGKRGGGDDSPERRCILSGRITARDELVRLALSPDNVIAPDALAKAPGRGAWIGVSRDELAAAMANGKLKGALARAFKTGDISIPENLPELTENALRQALLQRLGLEMRSGLLILGSDRIDGEARMGRVAALFHASDAKQDGSRKLDQAWRVGQDEEGSGLAGQSLPLDRSALSVALGRDNVVHLALADDRSAQRVSLPLGRLLNYLGAAIAADDGGKGAAGAATSTAATLN